MWGRVRLAVVLAVIAAVAVCAAALGAARPRLEVGPQDRLTAQLRLLTTKAQLVKVGNFPGGTAVTPDGHFLWTVSAGDGQNDIRIVSLRDGSVVQAIKLAGASGGVTLDGPRHRAYVSGEPDTDIGSVRDTSLPGRDGDVIHVFEWDPATGIAHRTGLISVPPPSNAPYTDSFPPSIPPQRRAWPERPAVSPDGNTLLVALGLADAAAIVDLKTKAVSYVATGSHPFGAAILPEGKTGLITNRGPGTMSVIDLAGATKSKDIQVGGHLSHPESITLDQPASRAYIPLANADAVAVVDTKSLALVRQVPVGRSEGGGSSPTAAAVTPDGRKLLVAESADDELAVIALPSYELVGRIPTADYPTGVDTIPQAAGVSCDPKAKVKSKRRSRHRARSRSRAAKSCDKIVWTAAKGFGLGPNLGPALTSQYFGIPFELTTKGLVTGYVGIEDVPSARELESLTDAATAQLRPITARSAPAGTPLRAGGPIKHVFYVVRENRTYDQDLGDDPRGDGEPKYAIFGQKVTPNLHALVKRFPLLDRVYADSEASIDGHYWTAAATTSDYVHRTWRQNYAGRRYPTDAWFYQIAYPQTGFLFDRADQQGVTWTNLGEGVVHLNPLPDRDRDLNDQLRVTRRWSNSDLGLLTPGGCYDPFIGTDDVLDAAGVPVRLYDSSKPAGAPEPSLSRMDCFKLKFSLWDATNTLPQLVYLTQPNDHTNGGSLGHHSPRAMIADNDLALGQLVDLISHSRYWKESAIFVLEDDSQDGFDHQDAHRIPAAVISPFAKRGAVIHTPYDMVSAIRSVELILGLRPMNTFDAHATPMYDLFDSQPANAEPFAAVAPTYNLLEENPAPASAAARRAARIDTTIPDHISQRLLDTVLWKSVHGPRSKPPPPGPNATPEDD